MLSFDHAREAWRHRTLTKFRASAEAGAIVPEGWSGDLIFAPARGPHMDVMFVLVDGHGEVRYEQTLFTIEISSGEIWNISGASAERWGSIYGGP